MSGKTSGLNLNSEQLAAVKYKKGPLLIIAGAGTGKTTVITERIKYLIERGVVKPSEILALTFTEKAAQEMEERVDVAMPYGYTQMWISTFHSFCDRLLRDNGLNIGLDPKYKLMSESEAIQLLKNNLFKLDLNYFRPLGNPTKFIGGMLQHFSRLQDEDVSPTEYIKWVNLKFKISNLKLSDEKKIDRDKYRELAEVYKLYNEIKVREGVLDFGDLIIKTLKLFRERPNILKKYRQQFKYILVDEFQDTNFAQNELVKLLVSKEKNITVVADDDQSIYRWRGAAISNVVQFRKGFPQTKIVVLTKNYRSTQEILDRAYDLIQFNNPDRLEVVERINKKLISEVKSQTSEISFIHEDRVEDEADAVAKTIKNLATRHLDSKTSEESIAKLPRSHDAKKLYNWSDFAILVRANNHADPFVRALLRHGIAYQFLGPGRLFKQPEVVDLIAYLKVLYNFEDSVSFYRVLSNDFFEINPRDLAALGNYARKYNLSLFEAAEKVDDIFVSTDTKEKVKKVLDVIYKHFKLIKKETAGQILYYFLEDTGLIQRLLDSNTPESDKRAKNISKFFDKLKSYEVDHEDATIPTVVDWLNLSMELGESPLAADLDWTRENTVNILTVHSAKGLEFPVVFLVNLVSQRFPSIERKEQIPIPDELIKEVLPSGDFHLQEERRLFYVGMTRAKEKLYFTAANYYGEGKREKKLSPFIFEALGDKAVTSEPLDDVQGKQLSFLDYSTSVKPTADNRQPTTEFHVDYLSYSQIETFRTCPLHYKLKYIYKVPTPPSSSQSFGTTLHAVFKDFYTRVKEGEEPGEKLMFDLLEKDWVKEGYTSKTHERKFYEKGKVYLSGFLKTGFDKNNLPEYLEQKFTLPLPSRQLDSQTSRSQDLKSFKPLKIGGVMDRVDIFKDGSLEIIDYKTGATIPSQKEVDENLQLSFYALAATKIPYEPYGKKPEKVRLSLYYLDHQEKITTTRTARDLDGAVGNILNLRDDIEKSSFECSGHMFCQQGCEFSLFCKTDE